MKKKVFGIILILIMALGLVACDDKNSNIITIDKVLETPNSELVNFELVDYNFNEAILVDKTTGVMYCWLTVSSGGITPLYNADGTLKLLEDYE